MPTLGIFTVKDLSFYDGQYYTYGGFGAYLDDIRRSFDKVILVAHVADGPPPQGYYLIPAGNLEVVHLRQTRGELAALLNVPAMFLKGSAAIRRMDVVHARMPDYTGVVGAVLARIHKIPCAYQIVADWAVQARTVPWRKKYGLGLLLKIHLHIYDWIERTICRGQLVYAQGQSCYWKHRNSGGECHLTISASHNLSDLRTPQLRFTKKPYQILYVARLTGGKNQQLVLHALAHLNRNQANWNVTLIGEGPHRELLEALARDLGISQHVRFFGRIGHGPELWKHFDAADVFVLASRSEGTPKVLLEAMARGLPVVASEVGGVPTMLDGSSRGLTFPDNDCDALVRCLERLSTDQSLQQEKVNRAFTYAAEHTVQMQNDKMLTRVFEKWPHLAPPRRAGACREKPAADLVPK